MLGCLPSTAYANANQINRIAGMTRYATMALVSQTAFPDTSDYAVLASGQDFPDALAASSLAGALKAPILLTSPGSLTSEARNEIQRLRARKVIIIGGSNAVSPTVEQQVRSMGVSVNRIAGATRYETALQIYKLAPSWFNIRWSTTAIIATGEKFADALSISPYAYQTASPFILSSRNGLDADSLQTARSGAFQSAIIVGGSAVVPDSVQNQLTAARLSVSRLAGQTRYDTSQQIGDFVLRRLSSSPQDIVFATGKDFPDALSGSALAGTRQTAMMLVENSSTPTIKFAAQRVPNVQNVYVLGGSNAVDSTTINTIARDYGLAEPEPIFVANSVSPGAFCSPSDVGKRGYSKKGVVMVCSYGNESRPRWRHA